MPFNSDTYRRNQAKRTALDFLAQARSIKARAAAGTAYDWEIPLIASRVKCARITWRIYLSWKRITE